jgi:hypothetical protein
VIRAWRDCVGNALEWAALDMVRVDTPGYVSSFESSKERHDIWIRRSRRRLQRYRREARGIKFTDLLTSEMIINFKVFGFFMEDRIVTEFELL